MVGAWEQQMIAILDLVTCTIRAGQAGLQRHFRGISRTRTSVHGGISARWRLPATAANSKCYHTEYPWRHRTADGGYEGILTCCRLPREMPATALDLPPELIRRIADELVNSSVVGIDAVDETDTIWSIKDIIAQCSLTCRYWSQIFRPYLFWEITLRSLADLEELTAIINSSRNAIREHIHVLRVDHRETSVPWLHRVAMLRAELPSCERATLQIESPLLGTSIRTLTTLHPLLPSAIPASYSSFTSLTLSSHRFGNFSELLRLVRGLDVLQDLTCSVVTWGARTPIRATERGVRLSKTLKDVSAISCQEHWPLLWLLTVTKAAAAAPSSPLLSVPELTTVAEIIETLLLCGRTPDEPQAYLQFATSMHVVAPEPNGPNNCTVILPHDMFDLTLLQGPSYSAARSVVLLSSLALLFSQEFPSLSSPTSRST